MTFFDTNPLIIPFQWDNFEIPYDSLQPIENLTIASKDFKQMVSGASLALGMATGSVVLTATNASWVNI